MTNMKPKNQLPNEYENEYRNEHEFNPVKDAFACNFNEYYYLTKDTPLENHLLERYTQIQNLPFFLNDYHFISKSYFGDHSFENNESSDATIHSGHRMFDLHGYTTLGAEQAVRRVLTSVDRSRQQVIKINVGQGSHSQDGKAKLPDVVKKVAKDLQLPPPVQHEKNKGYLLMILPPIILSEDKNTGT